ncbi:MAG: hypothetical protein ACRENE_26205 [Polyangiaceae bacterium]
MMAVVQHATRTIEAIDGVRFGRVLLLDPTSPGRYPEDIDRAHALLDADPGADGAVACSRPTFNPFWVGVVARDGYLAPAFDGGARYTRRQDVPTFMRINGALYLWLRDYAASPPKSWAEGKLLPLEIPEQRAFSIDDRQEFELIRVLIESGLVALPWLEASEG